MKIHISVLVPVLDSLIRDIDRRFNRETIIFNHSSRENVNKLDLNKNHLFMTVILLRLLLKLRGRVTDDFQWVLNRRFYDLCKNYNMINL